MIYPMNNNLNIKQKKIYFCLINNKILIFKKFKSVKLMNNKNI